MYIIQNTLFIVGRPLRWGLGVAPILSILSGTEPKMSDTLPLD